MHDYVFLLPRSTEEATQVEDLACLFLHIYRNLTRKGCSLHNGKSVS